MDAEDEAKSDKRSLSPKPKERSLSPKPRRSGRRSLKSRDSDTSTRRKSRKSHSSSKSPKRARERPVRISGEFGSPIRLQSDPIKIGDSPFSKSERSSRKSSSRSPKRISSGEFGSPIRLQSDPIKIGDSPFTKSERSSRRSRKSSSRSPKRRFSRSPKRSRERRVRIDGILEEDALKSPLDASSLLWVSKSHDEMMELKAIERNLKSPRHKVRQSTTGIVSRDRETMEKEKEKRYKSKSLSPVPRKRDRSPKRERDLKEKMKMKEYEMGTSGEATPRSSRQAREERVKREKRRDRVPPGVPGAVPTGNSHRDAKTKGMALTLDEFDSGLSGVTSESDCEIAVVATSANDRNSSSLAPRRRDHSHYGNTIRDVHGDAEHQNSIDKKQQGAATTRKYLVAILLLLFLLVTGAIATAVVLLTRPKGSNSSMGGTPPIGDTEAPVTTETVSDSPTAASISLPPSTSPEDCCDAPSQGDCFAIENGQPVFSQDSMIQKFVDLEWDVSLREGVNDMTQEQETVFYDQLQEYLAPSLAGCDLLYDRRTLIRSQRRKVLDASSFVIGNAIVTGRLKFDTQCNDEAPLPCFRILTRIELFLKTPVDNLDLYGLVGSVINPPNGADPLVQRLQLPDDHVKVEMILIGGGEGDDESTSPSLQPSLLPSEMPSSNPTKVSSENPTGLGTDLPSESPSSSPSSIPSTAPSIRPTITVETPLPSVGPSLAPTFVPTPTPTADLISASPTGILASMAPSNTPSSTIKPSLAPSDGPSISKSPSAFPTTSPTSGPTFSPTVQPTSNPTSGPTSSPTLEPTSVPTSGPTSSPTEETKCLDIFQSCGQYVSAVNCQILRDEITCYVRWCNNGSNRAGTANEIRFEQQPGGLTDIYFLKMGEVGGSLVEMYKFEEICFSFPGPTPDDPPMVLCNGSAGSTGQFYTSTWVNGVEKFTFPLEDIPFAADRPVDHFTTQGYSTVSTLGPGTFGNCPIAS